MRNNEISAWTLLVASVLLGSVTMLSLSGCKPPAPTNVDISTGEYVASNTTASNTSTSSNVTTSSSEAVETPIAADNATTEPAENEVEQEVADQSDTVLSAGGDWPQWGGTRERNNTPGVKNLPLDWNIGKFDRRTGDWDDAKAKNIRWFSNLGSQTYGNPVIAGGQVYVGTNNGAGHLKRSHRKLTWDACLHLMRKVVNSSGSTAVRSLSRAAFTTGRFRVFAAHLWWKVTDSGL